MLKAVLGLMAIVAAYFLMALICTLIPVNSDYKMPESGTEIWIRSNGVHTSIIVPVNSNVISWKTVLKTDNDCRYLVFGWGDKEFYMNTPEWSDLKLGTALKAVFWPTDAVMQVYCISSAPFASEKTIKIKLTEDQSDILNAYIYKSFDFNDDGSIQEQIPDNGSDAFYKFYSATGKYTLFFTCNNWTSRGLKKAGIKNALWAPFDKSVLYHLK